MEDAFTEKDRELFETLHTVKEQLRSTLNKATLSKYELDELFAEQYR